MITQYDYRHETGVSFSDSYPEACRLAGDATYRWQLRLPLVPIDRSIDPEAWRKPAPDIRLRGGIGRELIREVGGGVAICALWGPFAGENGALYDDDLPTLRSLAEGAPCGWGDDEDTIIETAREVAWSLIRPKPARRALETLAAMTENLEQVISANAVAAHMVASGVKPLGVYALRRRGLWASAKPGREEWEYWDWNPAVAS